MGMHLPPISKSRSTSSGDTRSLFVEDDFLSRIIEKMPSLHLISGSRKIASQIVVARVAGLSKDDILVLAQNGVFGRNSRDWTKIRNLFNASHMDAQLVSLVIDAGLTSKELSKLIIDGELDKEAVRLIARLKTRSKI